MFEFFLIGLVIFIWPNSPISIAHAQFACTFLKNDKLLLLMLSIIQASALRTVPTLPILQFTNSNALKYTRARENAPPKSGLVICHFI
jgi:hypothetical protein